MLEDMKETREWLQREFEHFEAEPPADLWPDIEARMEQEKKGRMKWIPYLSIAASILILLGLFGSLQMFERNSDSFIVKKTELEKPFNQTINPQMEENEITVAQNEDVLKKQNESEILEKEERDENRTSPKVNILTKPNLMAQVVNEPMGETQGNESESMIPENMLSQDDVTESILVNIEPSLKQIDINPSEELYDNFVPTKAVQITKRKPTNIKRIGSTNKLDLNDLTLENAVTFAANGLNRIVNSPLEIQHKKTEEESVKTYSFRLKNFSITRKQHVKTIKTDKS